MLTERTENACDKIARNCHSALNPMASPAEDEKAAIQTRILHSLSKTQYACTSLKELTGGTANFAYRGVLTRPLDVPSPAARSPGNDQEDWRPVTSIIVKHSTDYAAINRDFPLDLCRYVSDQKTP